MESIKAIDDLIVSLCEDAKTTTSSNVGNYTSAIVDLCSSLATLGVRTYTVSIPLDEKGNVRL